MVVRMVLLRTFRLHVLDPRLSLARLPVPFAHLRAPHVPHVPQGIARVRRLGRRVSVAGGGSVLYVIGAPHQYGLPGNF